MPPETVERGRDRVTKKGGRQDPRGTGQTGGVVLLPLRSPLFEGNLTEVVAAVVVVPQSPLNLQIPPMGRARAAGPDSPVIQTQQGQLVPCPL